MDATTLVEGILAGERRALSRAISHVEADSAIGREVLEALYPRTGGAQVVGITGSAGAGKSTLVGAIAREQRKRGRTVGIVAVDPSSPFSHGAILGDRIRMQDLTADGGVFLRSMASRGNLGGLSETATGVADVMDAAGFDIVLIETVGAGQDEVEVANAAGTTVLVANPGGGDDVQSMKAGLMEVAQVMVVNKADLAGADTAVQQLRGLLAIADPGPWEPPILKAIARTGEGVPELVDAIDRHQAYYRESEHSGEERRKHAERQVLAITRAILHREALATARASGALGALVQQVADRNRDPRNAAEELLEAVRREWAAE
ncbi:MAG: methylmalonyl Co-A mutase-associated GTPase MeaB [Chloroflexi bacterium]|nr:methylmalonyl Co-A mutase-associated GTPase MeaB [Chloroflexota bacterium]MDA1239983.1 methylmalonyl Co-A mutase-associated GTPase MeaB [Chloroflexota bacterium]MQC19414.1 methylmalonyl Co-A mutase-associated GTPase MeaB [Chloroflexota bacterium]